MSSFHIIESCSCGASIDVKGSAYRRDEDARNPRGAEEVVERWRTDHQHHEPLAAAEEARRPAKQASCGCDLTGMYPPAVHLVDRHEEER